MLSLIAMPNDFRALMIYGCEISFGLVSSMRVGLLMVCHKFEIIVGISLRVEVISELNCSAA